MNHIEIKLVDTWDIDQIVSLYKAGNWWKDHFDPSEIPRLIQSSFAFAIAVDTEKNIVNVSDASDTAEREIGLFLKKTK